MASLHFNRNSVNTTKGELYLSGDKSVNYRLGLVKGMSAFGLTSTRLNIDNSQFWANEYGIPTSGSALDITFLPSAITLGIASTSANDSSAGTGARTVLISGLNSNYDEISEIITLNGQTEVNTTQLFLRVNDAIVKTTGATTWNEGTIYIGGSDNTFTAGVPQQNVIRTIGVDLIDNKGIVGSTPSTYTIPRNVRAVPVNFKVSTDATANKPLLIRGIVKPFGFPEFSVGNLIFNGSNQFTFDGFSTLPEKSDIIVRSRAQSATTVNNSVVFWEWITTRTDINKEIN